MKIYVINIDIVNLSTKTKLLRISSDRKLFRWTEKWRNFLSHLKCLISPKFPYLKLLQRISSHDQCTQRASSLLIKITFCSAISALRSHSTRTSPSRSPAAFLCTSPPPSPLPLSFRSHRKRLLARDPILQTHGAFVRGQQRAYGSQSSFWIRRGSAVIQRNLFT